MGQLLFKLTYLEVPATVIKESWFLLITNLYNVFFRGELFSPEFSLEAGPGRVASYSHRVAILSTPAVE